MGSKIENEELSAEKHSLPQETPSLGTAPQSSQAINDPNDFVLIGEDDYTTALLPAPQRDADGIPVGVKDTKALDKVRAQEARRRQIDAQQAELRASGVKPPPPYRDGVWNGKPRRRTKVKVMFLRALCMCGTILSDPESYGREKKKKEYVFS